MRVASVINFKGGVGKTTLTANLGAELARRGHRVLLVDLDPQSSLTFSFSSPDIAAGRFPPDRSIKAWYDAFDKGVPHRRLSDCVVLPDAANRAVAGENGYIGLIPSTLNLIDHELTTLTNVGLSGLAANQELYRLRRALSDALRTPQFAAAYDVALIDCAPNFNIFTQSAIVACDDILIPSRPDYLSTIGIDALVNNVGKLVESYNHQAQEYTPGRSNALISPRVLGVVFSMVQYRSTNPISAHQYFMDLTRRRNPDLPIFVASIRENIAFGSQNPDCVPVILRVRRSEKIYVELMELATEFVTTSGMRARAVA